MCTASIRTVLAVDYGVGDLHNKGFLLSGARMTFLSRESGKQKNCAARQKRSHILTPLSAVALNITNTEVKDSILIKRCVPLFFLRKTEKPLPCLVLELRHLDTHRLYVGVLVVVNDDAATPRRSMLDG